MGIEGILLVDKPKGWTSFDVVNKVRGIIAKEQGKKPRDIKVGHTGTLDPAATGLLVLCVGKTYTKKVQQMIKHDKTYEAKITFGVTSTTGDSEGELTEDKTRVTIDRKTLKDTLRQFAGVIDQTPPDFSAVKINGKRAYELARAGKKIELKSRKIKIYSIELTQLEWPTANITCKVGSGTYIRVLAKDIGKEMKIGAYLSGLRRTEVDKWSVEDAVDPTTVSFDIIREKLLA